MAIVIKVTCHASGCLVGDGTFSSVIEPALTIKEASEPGADDFVGDGLISKFSQGGIANLGSPE